MYGFTSQELTTYLEHPETMTKEARDAFKTRTEDAYRAAKDDAHAAVTAADQAKKATQAGTAERSAAEATLAAAKDNEDALKKMGTTKWLQSVLSEINAANAQQSSSSGGSAGDVGAGSEPSDPGGGAAVSPSGPGTGVAAGGGASGGGRGGTPIDASAVRIDFGSGFGVIDEDEDQVRAWAIKAQARERLSGLVERLGQAPASGLSALARDQQASLQPAGQAAAPGNPFDVLRGKYQGGAALDRLS